MPQAAVHQTEINAGLISGERGNGEIEQPKVVKADHRTIPGGAAVVRTVDAAIVRKQVRALWCRVCRIELEIAGVGMGAVGDIHTQ